MRHTSWHTSLRIIIQSFIHSFIHVFIHHAIMEGVSKLFQPLTVFTVQVTKKKITCRESCDAWYGDSVSSFGAAAETGNHSFGYLNLNLTVTAAYSLSNIHTYNYLLGVLHVTSVKEMDFLQNTT
jgi:hypothetical protein